MLASRMYTCVTSSQATRTSQPAGGRWDWAKRMEDAELALSHLAGGSADKKTLPEGVVVVYPRRP